MRRDLTVRERIYLAKAIQHAPATIISKIVDVIRETNPSIGADGEEVKLDVGSLNDTCLWKIHDVCHRMYPKLKTAKFKFHPFNLDAATDDAVVDTLIDGTAYDAVKNVYQKSDDPNNRHYLSKDAKAAADALCAHWDINEEIDMVFGSKRQPEAPGVEMARKKQKLESQLVGNDMFPSDDEDEGDGEDVAADAKADAEVNDIFGSDDEA